MTEMEAPYRPTFWHVKLPITPELRRKVREYHEFHGDRSGYAAKVVRAEDGHPAVLSRATDGQGNRISVILGLDMDKDVYEICSCPRECEAQMVTWFGTEPEDNYESYGEGE